VSHAADGGTDGPGLLIVATARSGDIEPDSPLANLLRGSRTLDRLTEIELEPLSRADTVVLAGRLTGAAIDESSVHRLWRETEGNPLFVVESVRAGRLGAAGISPKVQAVIESRLAELTPPARELVGVAATIGRDFTVELLAGAGELDEGILVAALDELWRRRIVREQGGGTYDFRHDKIRAVAYAGVGPARRRHHHLRIARTLERDLGLSSAGGGQIASHYEQAGMPGDAADWYARAASDAQRLQADAEAIRLLERSRSLLTTLPSSRERDRRELAVLTALPAPLASVEGYASPRLAAVHDRAVRLAGDSGSDLAPPLLWSLAFASLVHEE
jgi:predicted ATPase